MKADVEDYLGKNMDVVLFLCYIFPLKAFCSLTATVHMYCTLLPRLMFFCICRCGLPSFRVPKCILAI